MSDYTTSDYEFDLATVCAALNPEDDQKSKFKHLLSKVRVEVISELAAALFAATSDERAIAHSLLSDSGWAVNVPVLEARLRYASSLAPVLTQMPKVTQSFPASLDRVIHLNIDVFNSGFALRNHEEVQNASVIAFLMEIEVDMQQIGPDGFGWIRENIDRLIPVSRVIRERGISSTDDMQRILDSPAPSLLEGIL